MEGREVSDMFRALGYVGTVKAVRQEYEVFRTVGGDYVVFSPSNRGASSFHMTLVAAEKVEALGEVVSKEGVTSGSLMNDKRVVEAFGGTEKVALRFDLLMALYVLTASGRVEMGKSGRNLVFTQKPRSG
jgi:hypothetical protein